MNKSSDLTLGRDQKASLGWLWSACLVGVLVALGSVLAWLASNPVSAQEAESEITSTFSPEVVILVPQTDVNNDGINDFSGTAIEVSYSFVGGIYDSRSSPDSRCTLSSVSETYLVRDDGDVTVEGASAELLILPELFFDPLTQQEIIDFLMEHSGVSGCEYSVSVQERSGNLLWDSEAPGTSLSVMSDSGARLVYTAFNLEFFSPTIFLSVPQTDSNVDGVNDYAGTRIVVEYAPRFGAPWCYSIGSETYVVRDDGSFVLEGLPAKLVAHSHVPRGGQETSCLYSSNIPETVGSLVKHIRSFASFDNNAQDFETQYGYYRNIMYIDSTTTFTSATEITVPQTDANGDGVNDYAGERIDVSYIGKFAQGVSLGVPVSVDVECSDSVVETYIVNYNGTVALDTSQVSLLAYGRQDQRNNYQYHSSNVFYDCEYEKLFALRTDRLLLSTPTYGRRSIDIDAPGDDKVTYVEYDLPDYFNPDIVLRIVWVDADGDFVHDLSGRSLTLEYRGDFYYDRCTQTASETYILQDNGNFVLRGDPASLKRTRRNSITGCYYGLVNLHQNSAQFGDRYYFNYARWFTPGYDAIKNYIPSFAFAGIRHEIEGVELGFGSKFTAPTFRPDVSFEGPLPMNTDLTITYASSRLGCTSSASETYVMRPNGATLKGEPAQLISAPARTNPVNRFDVCHYSVTWPTLAGYILDTENKSDTTITTWLPRNQVAPASPRDRIRIVGRYIANNPATSFSPDVSISVPRLDANGDGVNDFVDRRFVVSFSRVFGSDGGCTASASGTYVVQGSGLVTGSALSLADRPAGVVLGCSYVVGWPTVAGLVIESGVTGSVSASARSASASYRATVATSFSPDVDISVPRLDVDGNGVNDFAGRRFVVLFRAVFGSDGGCTASASGTYAVRSDGSVSGSDPSLVDRPAGVTTGCSYSVTWPTVSGLVIQPGATTSVSASARSASASYRATAASSFSPDVAISVPRLDADGNGVNDFSGRRFVVTFSRVFGSDSGCTASASRTYTVQNSGSVSGSDPSLVDRPAGVVSGCSYAVGWPTATGLVIESGATTSVSASARSASASYRATAASSFSPDVTILVPRLDANRDGVNDFAGRRFVVSFRRVFGSDVGCTDLASRTYTVLGSGLVTGSALSLVDRPAGVTSGCSYVVGWPTAAGLVIQPGATTSVSASARSASASYRATAASSFSPDVSISVPRLDANRDGVNDFVGRRFVVSFSPVFGSDGGCTASASGTFVVQGSGLVSGSDLSLVDRPAGVTSGCSYAVGWPTVAGLVIQPGATGSVSASAKAASASYRATAASSFSPDVTISVPRLDANRDGVNDFAGRRFVVSFSPVFGSDGGCTASASGTFVVQGSGVVSGSDLSLVDRPAGVTTGCTYAVSWPSLTDLVRQFGATATVSALAESVSATYLTGPTYVAPVPEVEELEVEDVEEPAESAPEVEEVEEPESEVVAEPEVEAAEEPAVEETQGPDGSAGGGAAVGGGGDTGTGPSGGGANVGVGAGIDPSGDVSESVPGAPVPEVGVIQLSQGWVMLPFNGPSGMSPADFASALEDAVNSVWVWDMATQQWKGWVASRGSLGLASLVPGDVVMVYVPTGGVVVYSPADLLGHRVGVNSWTLAPTGISLVVYGGGSATSASDVFASYANSAVVVYLWDSQNQRWEYHLPGRQPLASVQVPWFSDINPGDAMFVYNISPSAVTIPWQ